jgi:endonuclease III
LISARSEAAKAQLSELKGVNRKIANLQAELAFVHIAWNA